MDLNALVQRLGERSASLHKAPSRLSRVLGHPFGLYDHHSRAFEEQAAQAPAQGGAAPMRLSNEVQSRIGQNGGLDVAHYTAARPPGRDGRLMKAALRARSIWLKNLQYALVASIDNYDR
jgi:hypothetical protein